MKIAIVSNSCEVHARNLNEVLNKHLKSHQFTYIPYETTFDAGWELTDFGQYDALLNVGYFVPVGIFLETIRKAEPKLPIINIWVGSDILQNWGHYNHGMTIHAETARRNYINITDAPHFKKELEYIFHMETQVVKSCPTELFEVKPLPETPRFFIHIPAYRRDFYGFEMLMETASLNTDTFFDMVAHPEPKGGAIPNVGWHQWLNKDALHRLIDDCSGAIRMPLHDGYAVTSLEAMSAGRYVITNVRGFPHTIYVPDMYELCRAIRKVREYKEPNHKAAEWVRKGYAPEHMAESFERIFEKVFT